MPAPNEGRSNGELVSCTGQEWLGKSVWQVPDLEVSSRIKSSGLITAFAYHRGSGENIWRGDRHRIILAPDEAPPVLVQAEQGPSRQTPRTGPGTLAFYPAGLTLRIVQPAASFVQVLWDRDLHSVLLPELGAAASEFELLFPFEDPLLSQIVTTLAQETAGLARYAGLRTTAAPLGPTHPAR